MSNKVPQLRFNGYSDAWVQRKLADLSDRFSYGLNAAAKEYDGVHGYLRITDIDEVSHSFLPEGLTSPNIPEDQLTDYRMDEQSIVYARTGASTGKTYIYRDSDGELYYAGFLIRQKVNKETSAQFVYQNTLTKAWERYVQVMSQRSGQPGINAQEVGRFELAIPERAEQDKIAHLFNSLDNLIAANQRKLDLLKEQKKGYLQKMFPKNGAKVPELRFAGFADDWEERKLSSGLREYTDRVIVEDDKEYYQISVRNNFGGITLRGSKMGNKIGRKRQAKINLTKYPQTLIFTRQTVEQGGIGWVDQYCDGAIVTENMPTISLDTSVFSKYFLTNLFQTRIFYKNAILDNVEGGSAQIAIHESKFLSSTLLFPNLDEQEKIGQFFKQLDNTIALHQRKLELLKEQKNGFLQKMFV